MLLKACVFYRYVYRACGVVVNPVPAATRQKATCLNPPPPRISAPYCGAKGHYFWRDCKVKRKAEMIKASERSEANEFGNFAADEEYGPRDDESIREIGFQSRKRVLIHAIG